MKKSEISQYLKLKINPEFNDLEVTNVLNYVWADYLKCKNSGAHYNLQDYIRNRLDSILEHINNNVPIQYVTNSSCFYGIDLYINEDVLIPRPETEELVDWILKDNLPSSEYHVLDIGTGSACISIALKTHRKNWTITGVDISPAAIQVARQNGAMLDLDISFSLSDFLMPDSQPQGIFDIVVSNPPYVDASEMNLSYNSPADPLIALIPNDKNCLIFYEEIASWSLIHLRASGSIYCELNEFRFAEIQEIFFNAGFRNIVLKDDMQGKKRMIRVRF